MFVIRELLVQEKRHPEQERVNGKLDAEEAEAPQEDPRGTESLAELDPFVGRLKVGLVIDCW